MIENPKVVGSFIREKRIAAGLSQRALGQLFSPPVTTQFISNVERGVTPLPPTHVSTLAKALKISEDEILVQLEKEYAAKIHDRLGVSPRNGTNSLNSQGLQGLPGLSVSQSINVLPDHYDLFKSLYDAYVRSNDRTAFQNAFSHLLQAQSAQKTKTPF